MKSETRNKTIHYKRAVITNSQLTLQSLIKAAFDSKGKATKAKQRREVLNPDDQSCRLINHHKDYNGMLFGHSENDKVDDEKIKKRREFIDSMLYFGVLDNHVVLVQSASLRARELEAHLAWLLGSCTEVIDRNNALILQDKPSEETITKIEKSPVKSVHLGTPVEARIQENNIIDNKTESNSER